MSSSTVSLKDGVWIKIDNASYIIDDILSVSIEEREVNPFLEYLGLCGASMVIPLLLWIFDCPKSAIVALVISIILLFWMYLTEGVEPCRTEGVVRLKVKSQQVEIVVSEQVEIIEAEKIKAEIEKCVAKAIEINRTTA